MVSQEKGMAATRGTVLGKLQENLPFRSLIAVLL